MRRLITVYPAFVVNYCIKPPQISVQLPKEYAGFTFPIIKTFTSHSPDEEIDIIKLVEWNDNWVSICPFLVRPVV